MNEKPLDKRELFLVVPCTQKMRRRLFPGVW
jgi:hypothetical protein